MFVATESMLVLVPASFAVDHEAVRTATLAELQASASWWSPVPVMDATRWVDLRGVLRA